MSSFSEQVLQEKLTRLTSSQESIETLSLWIIHHRTNANVIATIWAQNFTLADPNKRVLLFYLVNDVLQNSRRKAISIFAEVFRDLLKQAVSLVRTLKVQTSIERIVHIWRERRVYDEEYLNKLDSLLENLKLSTDENSQKEKIDFKVSLLEDSLVELGKFEGEMKLKQTALSQLGIDVSSTSSLSKLKDKASGAKFKREFHSSALKLQDYVECTGIEVKERKGLLEMLKECKLYHKQEKSELQSLLKDYQQLKNHFESLSEKLKERIDELDKAQHTATSDPSSKKDITVVGDMEIDSDSEATEEAPPSVPHPLSVPFLPPTGSVPSFPFPPISQHSFAAPPTSFQTPPLLPRPPTLPSNSISIPYSPSMPKPYTPLTPPNLPFPPPPFPVLPSNPTHPVPNISGPITSHTPDPLSSALPTSSVEEATVQSDAVPESFFQDYSDSDSELNDPDKPYSPSNMIQLSPTHIDAEVDSDNTLDDVSPKPFNFYGSGNYDNQEDTGEPAVGDVIQTITPVVSSQSSKTVIHPEDIKITPSLTNILGEIFPRLSKSLEERKRQGASNNPEPPKQPKLVESPENNEFNSSQNRLHPSEVPRPPLERFSNNVDPYFPPRPPPHFAPPLNYPHPPPAHVRFPPHFPPAPPQFPPRGAGPRPPFFHNQFPPSSAPPPSLRPRYF